MHLVYSDAHLKYTDIVYTKRINEVYAVAHTIVLQPLLHSEFVIIKKNIELYFSHIIINNYVLCTYEGEVNIFNHNIIYKIIILI